MKLSRTLVTLAALLCCIPAWAQVNTAKRMIATLPKQGPVQRDAAAEKVFLDRHGTIVTQLTATAKTKLDAPVGTLLEQFAKSPLQSFDPGKSARQEVARLFPGATTDQTDLLTFYVLAEVLRRSPQQAEAADQGAGLNEISELNDQRVQQVMDRRSKFTAALSALAKKIAGTSDALVQNLK